MLVIWEMTQACDLSCIHCRAKARTKRHPLELSTAEAFHLIDQIAQMRVPRFALTGGDPLKRPDLMPIVQYACRRGVPTSLTPSATPLLTRDAIFQLKSVGLTRVALSLDGSTAELHDGFRRVTGAYKQTLDAVRWCHEAGLPVQVNTTVSRHNVAHLDNMIQLLSSLRIALWSVFFLVPTGRGQSTNCSILKSTKPCLQNSTMLRDMGSSISGQLRGSIIDAMCFSRRLGWGKRERKKN